MIDVETLNDALDTLKDRLSEGGDPNNEIAETVSEYGVKQALLIRKFIERYGVEPQTFVPPTSLKSLARRRARKSAVEMDFIFSTQIESLDWAPGDLSQKKSEFVKGPYVGAIFKTAGSEYAFIGSQFSNIERKYRIRSVPVEDVDAQESLERPLGLMGPLFAAESEVLEWLEANTVVRAEMPID